MQNIAADCKTMREKAKLLSTNAVAAADRAIYQAMDRSYQAHDQLRMDVEQRKNVRKYGRAALKNDKESMKMDWE